MDDHLELQFRLCPRGHVLLCCGDRQIRFSVEGFRRVTEAANRVVARLDAMERRDVTRLLH